MAATTDDDHIPALAASITTKQRLFLRYFTAILIDLVVLNLFVEYWHWVTIDSFTISLLASVLLQVLLKVTIAIEHWVAKLFKGRTGWLWGILRFFCLWAVLFGSKFVILEALDLVFGEHVSFGGPWHGIIPLIVVVVVMLVVEELIVRLVRKLG